MRIPDRIYYPTVQFPLGGRMTRGFSELVVGDSVELKGPIGHFIWKGTGVALCYGEERRVREIGLVCGGSGITVRTSSSPKTLVSDRSN